MQIITFFAPKGGVGRTLATVTAAMALVEAGKRVRSRSDGPGHA